MDAYKIISKYYQDKTTNRSGVKLMNHIDEGLIILDKLKASYIAKDAYCLHPILQPDNELVHNMEDYMDYFKYLHPKILIVAMEYRSVANEYLSTRTISSIDEIRLSPMKEVNDMLIADKIQNRKDFELYHIDTHERSPLLQEYFKNWLERLDISEDKYKEMISLLTPNLL